MKKSLWMAGAFAFAALFSSCSKNKGLAPEDTALIKGTDRGTFIGSPEDELSPLGLTITGLDGDDGLFPQDSFWDDDALAGAQRPFDPIFFGFDQYNVGAEERTKLQSVASFLNDNPNVRILIEGYCDWKGTPAYNKSLGDRRATSVKDYLVDLGVDDNRIEILSMGDEMATPDADPTTSGLERKAQLIVRRDS
jgi:peptidoglycan-associated lipoprotein